MGTTLPTGPTQARCRVDPRDREQSCRYPGGRCVSGESPPPPIGPLRPVLPTLACRGANSRCAPATPSSQTVRRCTGRACGRRPVRGVRSEEGKSGLEARRAPSPEIRHRRTGQLVTETMPACPSNHPRRRRHRPHTRRKTRFSTPTNPGAPAAPARWGGNREPIPDRPVSRRYEHVENALGA
jgi:hypothetical protein